MQFDVYPNPIPGARRAFPYVAVLQSNLAETGQDRVVAFLAPRAALPKASGRLMPIVRLGTAEFLLLLPSLTGLPATELRRPAGTIAAHRDRIIEALDWLFLGV